MNKKIEISELQVERLKYKPVLPSIFQKSFATIVAKLNYGNKEDSSQEKIKELFPNTYNLPEVLFVKGKQKQVKNKEIKVGVVLSGGQAPGGHNVISGLFDCIKKVNPKNKLIGFLGGPSGILENKHMELTKDIIDAYRNTGGFDMIQSGRTKIETDEQFDITKKVLLENKIDALIIIGGDDSNTNAALLAEYFKKENVNICVVGVPKTIDGDLKNEKIQASFGFDTATKIYSELVGNICRDVNSSRKYWHFIRLMGRSASHIALEVGLKTRPNVVLIGEEIYEKKMTLAKVVDYIADIIVKRAQQGKNFGVVLVPEGLIEFIPEVKQLISALNDVIGENEKILEDVTNIEEKRNIVYAKLPKTLADLLKSFPDNIESQLLLDRDPHGNVQVSLIETEKLLVDMLKVRLKELKDIGMYKGKFSPITHFFGYEGRCGAPSNFDANYAYALGYNAAMLAVKNFSGYISCVRNLVSKPSLWQCGGVPLTTMMSIEKRKGKEKPVIRKALVNLSGKPFKFLEENREKWAMTESYLFPGPIQYFGPSKITDITTKTLKLES